MRWDGSQLHTTAEQAPSLSCPLSLPATSVSAQNSQTVETYIYSEALDSGNDCVRFLGFIGGQVRPWRACRLPGP